MRGVSQGELGFYRSAAAMTRLPDSITVSDIPEDPAELRRCLQGLLVHRDWAEAYGIARGDIRMSEQNLRSVRETLGRAFEISREPITVAREPIDRVLCICRHFALVHVAFLRAGGIPARMRCGFSNYFDRSKWVDHWITERWSDDRWVREDPQIDELQAKVIQLDFDPYDQPPGQFLAAAEAWAAVRSGRLDAELFGIFDMWGSAFIAGNVLADLACLNKVELLPWDAWGLGERFGPHDDLAEDIVSTIDELAAIVNEGGFDAWRARYLAYDEVRVPADISTIVDGKPVPVHLEL